MVLQWFTSMTEKGTRNDWLHSSRGHSSFRVVVGQGFDTTHATHAQSHPKVRSSWDLEL